MKLYSVILLILFSITVNVFAAPAAILRLNSEVCGLGENGQTSASISSGYAGSVGDAGFEQQGEYGQQQQRVFEEQQRMMQEQIMMQGQSMRQQQAGGADNQRALEVSSVCPFAAQNSDVSSNVNQIKALLKDLKAQDEKSGCLPLKDAASASLENTLKLQAVKDFPQSSNGGIPTCYNYEGALRLEFQKVQQATDTNQSTSYLGFTIPAGNWYANCAQLEDSAEKSKCLQGIYFNKLTCANRICRDQKDTVREDAKNKQARDLILTLSSTTENLINGSEQCDNPQVLGKVMRASIASLTTLGAVAADATMIGTTVALAGKMLHSLTQRLLAKNSAGKALDDIAKEESLQNLQCVYMLSLRNSLSCDELIYKETPSVNSCNLQIKSPLEKAIAEIGDLTESMIDKKVGNRSTPISAIQKLISIMNAKVENENGEKESVKDHLKKMGVALNQKAQDMDLESANLSSTISNFSESYDEFVNSYQAKIKSGDRNPIDEKAVKKLRDSMVGDLGAGLTLSRVIQTGYQKLDPESSLASLEDKRQTASADERATLQVQEVMTSIKGADQRMSDVSHDALLRVLRSSLNTRLEQVGKAFSKNRESQLDFDAAKDAEYLLSTCTLNAGAFFFDTANSTNGEKSRNKIVEPSSDYKKYCKPLFCSGLIPEFEPKQGQDWDSPETASNFRMYQCRMMTNYQDIRSQIQKNPKLRCK